MFSLMMSFFKKKSVRLAIVAINFAIVLYGTTLTTYTLSLGLFFYGEDSYRHQPMDSGLSLVFEAFLLVYLVLYARKLIRHKT